MKVRAIIKNNITNVRVLAEHPMETGLEIYEETGQKKPAKYIQKLTCVYAEKVIFLAHFGPSVSENPYVSFSFKGGKKGDTLLFRWNDNTGDIEKTEAIIN
ncbi:MAG: thiosulfate oxidation carrier complex protein SoxZ [Cycloclasticus sp.]